MCANAELDEVPLVAEPYELTATENRIGMFLSKVGVNPNEPGSKLAIGIEISRKISVAFESAVKIKPFSEDWWKEFKKTTGNMSFPVSRKNIFNWNWRRN